VAIWCAQARAPQTARQQTQEQQQQLNQLVGLAQAAQHQWRRRGRLLASEAGATSLTSSPSSCSSSQRRCQCRRCRVCSCKLPAEQVCVYDAVLSYSSYVKLNKIVLCCILQIWKSCQARRALLQVPTRRPRAQHSTRYNTGITYHTCA
jgi:hypothetical protein